MRKQMTIILDADDVLYDSSAAAILRLNREYGTSYSVTDVTQWGSLHSILDKRLEYFDSPSFIYELPVFQGAKEFVHELDKTAEILVATSVPYKCAGARVSALIRDFPEIKPENILIGSRKDVLHADFSLDDAEHNIANSMADYPVLFRRPWNRHVTGMLAVSDYQDFLTLVKLIKDGGDLLDTPTDVVALIGPSGSGKSTIAERLPVDLYQTVSTYTTRNQREHDEKYHFISEKEFLERKAAGFFFETSSYMCQYYGTAREDVDEIIRSGKKAVLVLDINGAISMKKHYRDRCKTVFIKREREDCIRSILRRDVDENDKVRRILSLDSEMRNEEFCDYVIKNDMVTKTLMKVMEVTA